MKSFELLLFIIFILSNVGVKGSSFSIDVLLDYLQEKQYYEIIYQIKLIFGDDITISVCKSFIATNHCEEVVRTYMTSAGSRGQRAAIRVPTEEDLSPECRYILSNYFILPAKRPVVICVLYHYDTLEKSMNENEIIELIEKIVGKRLIKLLPNKELIHEIEEKLEKIEKIK